MRNTSLLIKFWVQSVLLNIKYIFPEYDNHEPEDYLMPHTDTSADQSASPPPQSAPQTPAPSPNPVYLGLIEDKEPGIMDSQISKADNSKEDYLPMH